MKILIVDDYRESRWALKRLLEDSGHEVLTAEGKDQALGLIRQPANLVKWQVELVITDLDMGKKIDGLDLLKEADPKSLTSKFWLISSGMTKEIAAEAKRLGANLAMARSGLLDKLRTEKIIS